MEYRPCIDIHNGAVKQIVGSSLTDYDNQALENHVSAYPASHFANIYKEHGLKGGHVIILNSRDSEYYESSRQQALSALSAYPGGLQIGGGIDADNAMDFISAGASHVIVTSFVFADGMVQYEHLHELYNAVGHEHIVLDLSCRKKDDAYYVVTDRWQKFTTEKVTPALFEDLSQYCDEFLVHAVDVEGKSGGIDENLLHILARSNQTITYAGGISSISDIERIRIMGEGRIHFTIGSAMKMFGGTLELEDVIQCIQS